MIIYFPDAPSSWCIQKSFPDVTSLTSHDNIFPRCPFKLVQVALQCIQKSFQGVPLNSQQQWKNVNQSQCDGLITFKKIKMMINCLDSHLAPALLMGIKHRHPLTTFWHLAPSKNTKEYPPTYTLPPLLQPSMKRDWPSKINSSSFKRSPFILKNIIFSQLLGAGRQSKAVFNHLFWDKGVCQTKLEIRLPFCGSQSWEIVNSEEGYG